jgi:polyisoprenoid-binding protein YceI
MKALLPSFLLGIAAQLLAMHANAQQQTFSVDPQLSDVAISLGDVLHSVHGNFHVQSGSVQFDRTTPTISGTIIVAANSGRTGNDSRDRRMMKDILDAPHFADISFSPKNYQGAIAPSGDSTIQVTGTFTIHGAPHDLTVPMQVHIEGTSCTAQSHFSVPYVKWGLKDPSTFILRVGKEVDIDLKLVGTLSPVS